MAMGLRLNGGGKKNIPCCEYIAWSKGEYIEIKCETCLKFGLK